MKLQVFFLVMVLGLAILRLCELITVFIFGMELYLIFTVFLLNILWNLLCGGKCLCVRCGGKCLCGKCFQAFVTKFALYGGLNDIIFLFRFLVVVVFCPMFCWYRILPVGIVPAFVIASLYGLIEFLNLRWPITVLILILLNLAVV